VSVLPSSRNQLVANINAPSYKSSISATQTVQQGYKTFDPITSSDWWWWYIALDIPDALLNNGEILYQYATIIDGTTSYTVGCSITIGTANSYAVDVYENTASTTTELDSASSVVIGKAYNGQAPDLIEESDAHKWTAGTTHVPNNAPASTTSGNTNQACYFYEELPKIGRNPSDFNKNVQVKMGARIYSSATATTFDSVPASTVTVNKAALAAVNYQAAVVVSAAPVVVVPVVTPVAADVIANNPAVITPDQASGHGSAQPHIAVVPGGSSALAMAFASLFLFFSLMF
jgi:hypothetical protein